MGRPRGRLTHCACGNPRRSPKQHNCNACHAAWQRANGKRYKAMAGEERERYLARRLAQKAVIAGKLIPQPCETCGSTEHIEKHHEDYSKPLEVRWFCRPHHVALH